MLFRVYYYDSAETGGFGSRTYEAADAREAHELAVEDGLRVRSVDPLDK